jgi:cell division protein FtsQ
VNLRTTPRASPNDADDATVQIARKQFARRRLVRRLVALRPLLVGLAVVLAAAGLVWVLFFSTLLATESVEVRGTGVVSAARVRELAAVPMGEPMARVDTDAVRARIEDLAAVKSVEVTRCWPHTVCIDVTERQSIAVVEKEGTLWGLDSTGILFRKYSERPAELPLVHIKATASTDALAEAAGVVSALTPSLLRRVVFLDVQTVDEITLKLRSGAVVVWGSAEESANKVRVLEPLLAARPNAVRYNVSAPGNPTVTLR